MYLNSDQVDRLIQLVGPYLRSDVLRGSVLGQAFARELAPIDTIEQSEAVDNFIASLINRLNNEGLSPRRGELTLSDLLQTLQEAIPIPEFSASLQPYIQAVKSNNVTAHPNVASVDPASQSTRKRRHRSPVKRGIRRITKLVRWRVILPVLLIAVIIPAAGVLVLATDANTRVQESLSNIKRVANTLTNRSFTDLTLTDFERLQASVRDLAKSLTNARQQSTLLRPFSFLNPDLGASFETLSGAEQVAFAAQNILDGFQPVLFFLAGGQQGQSLTAQISSGERLVELLRVGQGKYATARDQLLAAQDDIKALNLSGLSPDLLLQIEELQQYHAELTKVDQFLLDGPDLLTTVFGLNAPQNYLVLSENSDELRPSGGYISTYGWLRVRRFRITDYAYSATTTLSPNPPPAEMVSALKIPDWWIHYSQPIYSAWDGSWYADYPQTAKMAAWFYDNGQNPRSPVDGVIAIDMIGFEKILDSLGSVSVRGYNEVITSQNFREVVYRIRAESEEHKQFLAAVYKQIFADWQNIDEKRATPLLNAVLTALREKHVMIYFTDARLNEFMKLLGWDGAQTPGNYDYLMVADANLGNKSNSSIIRSITYDVTIQPDGSLQCRAAISYDYSASMADNDPAVKPQHYGNQKDYANLMQVFVPKGSSLTGTDNIQAEPKTVYDGNLTDLVTTVLVNFDSTERYQYSYTTIPLVEPFGAYRRYRLLLQKQPGTPGDMVNVQVVLPPGASLVSASPAPAANYTLDNAILEFRLQLLTDQWIEIIFK